MKPKKKHSSRAGQSGAAASFPAPELDASSGSRRRWFRFIALFVPVVGLLLLELLLRVLGVGYPTAFFLKTEVNGRAMYIENQQFSRRYFPPGLERTPQPVMFPVEKPADTIRIFVLGESAAMGDPEPAYGLARILEVLLREAMPGKKIEVINAAVTAINSHVVREIAKDCAGNGGDYWILYMGNNEVVGPFGAGTVFGDQTPGLGVIRANLALKSTRLGQLFDALRYQLGAKSTAPSSWEGMEMFLHQQVGRNDPRLAKVYAHFEANLRDIIQLGERSGAKVIVSTVAANLKNCPPFASQHRVGFGGGEQAEWTKARDAGIGFESKSDFAAALKEYERALKLDDQFAEMWFRAGRCQLALGRFDEARKSFERALDLDALRFRADPEINRLNAAASKERAAVDAISLIATNSVNGIAGEELFYEHVHFNFAGNYLLARAYAAQILGDAVKTAKVLSSEECARRLAFTDFNRYRVLDEVRERLRQPPFNAQLNHAERDARLGRELAKLDRASFSNAVQMYEEAIARSPDDAVLHENFATLLQDFGREPDAQKHWRRVIELLPHSEVGFFGLANLLDAEGRAEEAVALYREALRLRPRSAETRNGLALALASQGRFDEAFAEYERLIQIAPGFVEARINLGLTLAGQGKHQDAARQYLEVIRLQSNNVPARVNLGKLFAVQGKHADAANYYRESIRLKPESAVAHYNLGNALTALGDAEAAMKAYAEAVKYGPTLAEARYNLALGLARLNRNAEALEQLAEAVRLKPRFAEARFNLGVAYAKAGRFAEAVEQFRETLRLDPNNAAAKKFLEQAQAKLIQGQ
ncbi:MAG: tetratricopeptide repeat protein [Verrucomicrobia bacterium]|nr:tetratricopeptide repeat protein [Verrucomicrobiota bacterium]